MTESTTDEALRDEPVQYGGYQLLSVLGRGGTAKVYLARPIDLSRGIPAPVVIKRMHHQLMSRESVRRRFQEEAELAMAISSPHVVRVYDVGIAEGTWYIAMELISGWRLSELADALAAAGRLMPVELAAGLVLGALGGLSAIHEATDGSGRAMEIVHRDLSPNNLMVGDDGALRIIDLGLGKWSGREWQTEVGRVIGTRGYMSPEHLHAEAVDRRADIYVIGVVLYELLTGARYFENRGSFGELAIEARMKGSPRICAQRAEVSAELEAVVARAVAFEPLARFQSAGEFAAALRAAVPGAAGVAAVAEFLNGLMGERLEARRAQLAVWDRPRIAAATAVTILSPRAEAPPAGRSSAQVFLLLAVVVLLAGVAAAVALLSSVPEETVQLVEPPAPARVEARARAVEPEAVVEAPELVVEEPAPVAPAAASAVRKARRPPARQEAVDEEPPVPEAPDAPELMRRIASLASELRRVAPARQAEIDRIVSDASLAHDDPIALERLLAALRAIER